MYSSLIWRNIFCKWYSLKTPNYLRPHEVQLLHNTFKQSHSSKLQQLQDMSIDRLEAFYKSKTINTLPDQELYFLMNSNIQYNLSRTGQTEAINRVHSVYFKCLLYREFCWIYRNQQYLIALSFNEQVTELLPQEIVFCIDVIHDFEIHQALDYFPLEKSLRRYVDDPHYAHEMILINGYLSEMKIKLKNILNEQTLERWVANNSLWDFRVIYFVYKLNEFLQIEIKPQLKQRLDELMKTTIKSLKFDRFDTDYLAFLLKYYPEHVHKLNILHFSPKAYIDYLRYLKEHPQAILQHKTPPSVLQLTDKKVFWVIMTLREELKLDTPQSIAKNLSDYFVPSLNPVITYINHLKSDKLITPEIQYLVEGKVKNALQLKEFRPSILEEYDLGGMTSLLGKMSMMKMCSIDFWRMTVFWLEELISYNEQYNVIPNSSSIYVNLLPLVLTKNSKESTRRTIFNKIIDLLEREEHWALSKIYKLTSALSESKVGEPKIWLLIEHRLYQHIKVDSHKVKPNVEENLRRITIQLGIMNKGTFELWKMLNSALTAESKKQILEKSKNLSSLVHLHLKIYS